MTLTIELEPAGAAGMRSGMAWPKAPNSRLRIARRSGCACRPRPGNCGLTTVPSGRMQWNGRVSAGVQQQVGVERVEDVVDADQHQRVMRIAAGRHVERRGELRIAAGEVEDRANRPRCVSVTRQPRTDSRPARPRRRSRRRSTRRPGSSAGSRAPGARHSPAGRSMPWRSVSAPNLAMSSRTLRSPVFMAPTKALRSPKFCSGLRTLVIMTSQQLLVQDAARDRAWSAGSGCLPDGSRSARATGSAGTAPPMSVLWMWPAAKQTSSPSWKIGFQSTRSGVWVAR